MQGHGLALRHGIDKRLRDASKTSHLAVGEDSMVVPEKQADREDLAVDFDFGSGAAFNCEASALLGRSGPSLVK